MTVGWVIEEICVHFQITYCGVFTEMTERVSPSYTYPTLFAFP